MHSYNLRQRKVINYNEENANDKISQSLKDNVSDDEFMDSLSQSLKDSSLNAEIGEVEEKRSESDVILDFGEFSEFRVLSSELVKEYSLDDGIRILRDSVEFLNIYGHKNYERFSETLYNKLDECIDRKIKINTMKELKEELRLNELCV